MLKMQPTYEELLTKAKILTQQNLICPSCQSGDFDVEAVRTEILAVKESAKDY